MKSENTILLIIAGLYLFSKMKPSMISPMNNPGFVGPLQTPYVPTTAVIGGVTVQLPATISTPQAPANAGLQTCAGNDGGTFLWPTNQSCPYVDFVQNGVPYYIDAIGNPIPQTY